MIIHRKGHNEHDLAVILDDSASSQLINTGIVHSRWVGLVNAESCQYVIANIDLTAKQF